MCCALRTQGRGRDRWRIDPQNQNGYRPGCGGSLPPLPPGGPESGSSPEIREPGISQLLHIIPYSGTPQGACAPGASGGAAGALRSEPKRLPARLWGEPPAPPPGGSGERELP